MIIWWSSWMFIAVLQSWTNECVIYFAANMVCIWYIHGSKPVSRLEQQEIILSIVIPGSTQKGPEQWCKFLFHKVFERTTPEKYKMFNHWIWWQSVGRAWNVQNGLEAGRPSLSPEGDRQKGTRPPGRYPRLSYNLFLVDANFDGGSRWLHLQTLLFLKLFTSKTVLWPL